MKIKFRQAQPEDVDQATPLIYKSGPPEIDYVFDLPDSSTPDFLRAAFVAGHNTFGFDLYVVALVQGQVAAIGAFCSGAEFRRLTLSTGWQIVKFFGPRRSISVLRRARHVEQILPPPGGNCEYFTQLAVVDELQQQGIATALLQRQIEQARRRGRHSCVLDVSVDNQPAQKLYERLGFTVVNERHSNVARANIVVPDHRRMELIL